MFTDEIAKADKITNDVFLENKAKEAELLDKYAALDVINQDLLKRCTSEQKDLKATDNELVGRRNALQEKLQHLKSTSSDEKLKSSKTTLQMYKILTGTSLVRCDKTYIGYPQQFFEIAVNDPEATDKLWSILGGTC